MLLATAPLSIKAQGEIEYVAVELDSASHAMLADYAGAHLPWPDARIIAHHMTIIHHTGMRCSPADSQRALKDYVLDWALSHEGETVELLATEVGASDKAFAMLITDTSVPSRNALKHITLATHTAAGGKAVDSNFITLWSELPEPLKLRGKVTVFYK